MGAWFSTQKDKDASVHKQSEGNNIRNSELDTKEIPTSHTRGFTPIQGCLSTPMEPRELEWSDDGLEPPKLNSKRKLLQSAVQGPSETLGRKNKKRKLKKQKNSSSNANEDFSYLR